MASRKTIGFNLLHMVESCLNAGIGKYALDLLDGFGRLGLLEECVLFVREDFAPAASRLFPGAEMVPVRLSPALSVLESRKVRGAGVLKMRDLFQRKLPPAVRGTDIGVLFHPFNDKAARMVPGIPNIMTVHDLYYRHYGDLLPFPIRWLTAMGHEHFVRRSDRIAAISGFVRSDLLASFPGLPPERVVVLPNAVSMPKRSEVHPLAQPPVRGPYILCVNSLRRHKNTRTLLKAFRLLLGRIPHALVLLGQSSWRRDDERVHDVVATDGMSDRVTVIERSLSDDERNGLLAGADLFVSPSLFEGFGRTPVEAGMLEVPVLTTRETSLPEATMGLLASYGPARDEGALAEAIIRILADPPSPERRRETARLLREQYAPERVAGLCYALCREVMEGRPCGSVSMGPS